jgi:hypothetical protein
MRCAPRTRERTLAIWRAAGVVGLCLATLACVPGAIITSEGAESPYSYLEFVNAAAGRNFLVEVRGVPFAGIDRQSFEQRLMEILRSAQPPGLGARFTTDRESQGMASAYRLVLVFNPARNLAHETQCRALETVQPGPIVQGRVRVSVAYCRSADLMSKAVAQTSAGGIDDPAFRQMFVELFPVMFPPRNPFIPSPFLFGD